MLDIWDEGWMQRNDLTDPRTVLQKQVLHYLRRTSDKMATARVRTIDKLLKLFV